MTSSCKNILWPNSQGLLAVILSFLLTLPSVQAEPLPPSFSHQSGFYSEEFELALNHDDKRVTIFYTLDSSMPDPKNLSGTAWSYKNHYQKKPLPPRDNFLYSTYQTHIYTSPIQIQDRSTEPNRIASFATTHDEFPDYLPGPRKIDSVYNTFVTKLNKRIMKLNHLLRQIINHCQKIIGSKERIPTTYLFIRPLNYQLYHSDSQPSLIKGVTVRAMAVNQDGKQSKVATQTYLPSTALNSTLPVLALTVPEKDLFSYEDGVFVPGQDVDRSMLNRLENPKGKSSLEYNWNRKPIRIAAELEELSKGLGPHSVHISVHGGHSRSFPIKSIRLYPAGNQTHNLFEEVEPWENRRINLRNAGNAWETSYLHDAAAHEITRGLAFGTQRYAPALVFINGEYYGLLNARDRKDSRYVKKAYDLPKRKTDLLKVDYSTKASEPATAQSGSTTAYRQLLAALKPASLQNSAIHEPASHIDLTSMVDYFAASIFLARTDWPGNNQAFWRYKGKPEPSKPASDGRWRWLLYDADHSLKDASHSTLSLIVEAQPNDKASSSSSTDVIRSLLNLAEVRRHFIVRFSDLLNTTFAPERTAAIIRQLEQGIEKEMPRHIERWHTPISMNHWRASIDNMVTFVMQRPAIQRQHLQEVFSLEDSYQLTVNVSGRATGTVKVNTLHLGLTDDELEKPVAASDRSILMESVLSFPWEGQYFQKLPLRLEAVPRPGYRFHHWQLNGTEKTDQNLLRAPVLSLAPEGDLNVMAVFEPLP